MGRPMPVHSSALLAFPIGDELRPPVAAAKAMTEISWVVIAHIFNYSSKLAFGAVRFLKVGN